MFVLPLPQGKKQGALYTIASSPDGNWIAAAGYEGIISLWNAQTYELETQWSASPFVQALAFSPDSAFLAGGVRTIVLWEIPGGKRVRSLKGHRNWVHAVSFSPNGTFLATGSGEHVSPSDDTLRLWNAASGTLVQRIKQPEQVMCLAFSPDGRTILTACGGGHLCCWDIYSGGRVYHQHINPPGYENETMGMALSPDGTCIAAALEWKGGIHFFQADTGEKIGELGRHSRSLGTLAFSPDGRWLAGAAGKDIHLWDVPHYQLIATLAGHKELVKGLAFASGSSLVSCDVEGKAILWDLSAYGVGQQELLCNK